MRKRRRLTTTEALLPLERLDAATVASLQDGEEVDHTPIIVTDGSVGIDFSSEEYAEVGGLFVSAGLNLHLIEATHATHEDGSALCYFARPNEQCIVVFHTTRPGGGDETITIQGGLGTSPTVVFRGAEYPRDNSAPAHRRVHRNPERRLTALEIFRVRGVLKERVHLCPLVGAGARYRVWDPHED
jgi:hypothetical protein